LNVDRKNRIINLSVKSKDSIAERSAVKEHSGKQADTAPAAATIGDLIKAQMQSQDK